MHRFKRYFAIGSCILLVGMTATGCSGSNSNSGTSTSPANNTSSPAPTNTVASDSTDTNKEYGKVTAIDGTSITLALGEMSLGGGKGNKPSGDGTAPSGAPDGQAPSGDGTAPSGAPDGQAPSGDGTAPSGAPDGQAPSGDGTAPSGAPDGQAPSGDGSQSKGNGGMGGNGFTESGETKMITITDESIIKVMSAGETTDGSLESITTDSILSIEYDANGNMTSILVINSMDKKDNAAGAPSASGSSTGSITLTGALTVDGGSQSDASQTSEGETINSTEANQNTVLVKNSGSLTLSNGILTKSGDTTDNDESNFYAVNAIFAAVGGSTATITDTTLTSSSEGSNAIFASGEGSTITAENINIHTTGNSSRGLDATYGGTVIATNVTITTEGDHCAPLATDRGEGTITVDTGTVSAAGDGSPCIYSTGNITASNLTGTATDSQCAVVEGKNTITLTDCDLTGAGKNGVMLYQSTSGDAAEGTCIFTSTNSKLTTTSTGEMFYITNTDAEIDLTNTELSFSSGILLNASGNNTNNWGTEGSNGGNVLLKGTNQILTGDITCDSISTAQLNLTEKTAFTGAIDTANTGDVSITLDSSSSWKVTADSYLTAFTDSDSSLSNIISNGHTIYYDNTNSANSWLNGETITLSDGGSLTPMN